MNEAEIAKIVAEQLKQQGNNTYLGFIILGGLYVVKELWRELQRKQNDPDSVAHKETTRQAIAHIEERQTELISDIKEIRHTVNEIQKELYHKTA